MSSIIAPRDRANFAELINSKLDSIPIHNQEEARIAAAALGSLIGRGQPQEIPPSLLERITDIRDLMNDPLSVGDPSLYPNGQLQQYQQIAMERIPAKIQELLSLTPSEIEREEKRLQEQRSTAERDQEYLRTRQPPTDEASTISEAAWLRQQQEEFQREGEHRPVRGARRRDLEGAINLGDLPPLRALEEIARHIRPDEFREAFNIIERIQEPRRGPERIPENRFSNAGEVIEYLRGHARDLITVFQALPARWCRNRDVVLAAVRLDGTVLGNDPIRGFEADREIALEAIRQNIVAYMYVDRVLQRDKNFAIAAIRVNLDVFNYLSDELQHDPDVRREAHRL